MVKCQSKKQKNNKMNYGMKSLKRKKGLVKKRKGRKFNTKNKKIILKLIKFGNELYNIRDKMIDVLGKKEIVEPNFEWIRDTEAFNEILGMVEENIGLQAITDSKIVNLKSGLRFIDDILSGKTNNKYDAEKVYIEIMKEENLLRNCKNF